jgi:hypothetical protein
MTVFALSVQPHNEENIKIPVASYYLYNRHENSIALQLVLAADLKMTVSYCTLVKSLKNLID